MNNLTFVDALLAAGYVLDEDNYDEGCYVKTVSDLVDTLGIGTLTHVYQIGEDEGEWNYVKMTEDYDVLTEVTFNPDTDTISL
jgi:hypothetical protein